MTDRVPDYQHPEPEFTRHEFDPDPYTQGLSCLVCGFDRPFHGRELGPEIPDDPRPQFCTRCPHPQHSGACPDALPAGFGRGRACPCTGEKAVA